MRFLVSKTGSESKDNHHLQSQEEHGATESIALRGVGSYGALPVDGGPSSVAVVGSDATRKGKYSRHSEVRV